jgi:hypothetical protein
MGLVTRSANALQATTAVRREVADYGESVSGHDFVAQLITFPPWHFAERSRSNSARHNLANIP